MTNLRSPSKEPRPLKTGVAKRSTWNPTNAEKFRPGFDQAIETLAPVEWPYESFGVTPDTLYIKVTDALRWLCVTPPVQEKYLRLKAMSVIRRETDGITLRFKTEYACGHISLESDSSQVTWKDKLLKFLAEAQDGEMLEMENLLLVGDSLEILAGICSGVATHQYNHEKKLLRIIKGI